MKRFMALMSATALGLGSMAWAETAKVDSLIVAVSPKADDANVTEVWPNLEADLKSTMDEKFATLRDNEGFDLSVRVIEVSLDGSQILTENEEFNHLEGWVYVRPDGNPSEVTPFKVTIDAKTGALYKDPDGIVQIPGQELFYSAMVNGFADKTLEAFLEME